MTQYFGLAQPFAAPGLRSQSLPKVLVSLVKSWTATFANGEVRVFAPPTILAASQAEQGRLAARPVAGKTPAAVAPGLYPLGLSRGRDGLLYVPEGYLPEEPAPFVLLLHGAGGSAQSGLSSLRALADANRLLLLAPDSRAGTWDFIVDEYGPDVEFINAALRQLFAQYAIDPARLAIGGFSDGASYALSLGITNGDLFTHILSFSPGFTAPASRNGKPRIFISHGTRDAVLPIDRCSRRIVPQLQRSGYDVTYQEFDGPHTVPPDIAQQAVAWFLRPPRQ